MIVRERDIEQYLVKRAKAAGGRAYKFVSPGNNGVPDRIVLLPGGRIAFAELKAPGKKPTPLQMNQQRFIAGLSLPVAVIDNKGDVDSLISRMQATEGMPQWPEQ
ncbi:VRR-NUC domain-containing protein [Brevibacillus parabrevis]|nr:VRR-NUC domain-containing protein [Brevibacillus parabrevis]